MKKLISIIIRTLNEEKYLIELITTIKKQVIDSYNIEIIIVDSGSTDNTIDIAKKFSAKIVYIKKNFFSFGRSLNLGCRNSSGSILVFISGHCVPKNNQWLKNLIEPVIQFDGYAYGRQLARDTTPFSEKQVFNKNFPSKSKKIHDDYFCNNANAAISKKVWNKYKFDEKLTGCEDMDLAKKYFKDGGKIVYVPRAAIYHIHNESWLGIRKRYEREALALQKIMPEVHLSIFDCVKFFILASLHDLKESIKEKCFTDNFCSIFKYRFQQYYGSYRGNKMIKKISRQKKLSFFYPTN